MISRRRSFITGVKGLKLNKNEIFFLKKYKPWGVILFSRNIKSISQTQKLTSQIKSIFQDENYPILIDEEGGKAIRMAHLDTIGAHHINGVAALHSDLIKRQLLPDLEARGRLLAAPQPRDAAPHHGHGLCGKQCSERSLDDFERRPDGPCWSFRQY